MCCRVVVVCPFQEDIARAILLIGMFEPRDKDKFVLVRRIVEEDTVVSATYDDALHGLKLQLSPPIGTQEQHNGKRLAGSVMFEIAAKYAEKVDGVVSQLATQGCTKGESVLVLAKYPDIRLNYERICAGFQRVLLEGT